MPDDVCTTIKVALDECEERLKGSPRADEALILDAQKNRLKALWKINQCGGGIDWDALRINPPTDEEIDRVNELMKAAGKTTVQNLYSYAISDAVIVVAQAAGGKTV